MKIDLPLGDGPSDRELEVLSKSDPKSVGLIWVDDIKRILYGHPSTRGFYLLADVLVFKSTKITLDGHEYNLGPSEFSGFVHIVDLKVGDVSDVLDAHDTAEKPASMT